MSEHGHNVALSFYVWFVIGQETEGSNRVT